MKKLTSMVLLGLLLLGLMPMIMEAEESMLEPELQVKLVNYLGNRTNVSLNVLGSYTLDGTSTKLSGAKTYTVKAEQSNISLYDGSTKLITGDKVSITPDNSKNSAIINGREYQGSFSFIVESGLYVRPINKIYLEDYLKSVVPAEMYASWDKEALKVQAVAARTYAYFRLGKVINDTTSYQVYGGANMLHPNSTAAVEETAGQIVTYDGRAIDALFSASNGGMSENNHNEFGSPALPYFPIQRDDYDKKVAWNVSIQKQQINLSGLDLKNPNSWWYSAIEKDANFTEKIKSWLYQNGYSNKSIKIVSISKLAFYDKTESGRVSRGDLEFQFFVKDKFDSTGKLELQNGAMTNVIADRIRSYIGMSNMTSTLITGTNESSTAFSFAGLGNGHGVGMSQHGANNRVEVGYNYQEVLAFYYPGTTLVKKYVQHEETNAYPQVNVQLNGSDFNTGYLLKDTTFVNWNALNILNIPYTYEGNGMYLIEGRSVKTESINGDWYIPWDLISPGKIVAKQITGGYNFIYTSPIKIQLNGNDFAKGGYSHNGTTYINYNALKTLKISYTYKGSGVFYIDDRTVKAVAFNGEWYIDWKLLSPERMTLEEIPGGYNFIYTTFIKIQLNGNDFAKGGHFLNGTAFVNYYALKILNIPYTYKGSGVFVIDGNSVRAEAINGDWFIQWNLLSSGNITSKTIDGGYNLIYTAPLKIQLNGVDFAKGGYLDTNTLYINWNAIRTLNIPYTYQGSGVFLIEGRSVKAVANNGDWYLPWNLLSPDKIKSVTIDDGYNLIYTTPIKVKLNGMDFAKGGYLHNNTPYINWNALKTLNIPYKYNGNGVFVIDGRTVKAEAIKGDWFIQWDLLSPEKISSKGITGGYNFIYLP
ncbi:SpoIID/LytB domain-containing protein [Neobacillus vireti]|uniref:SpoIID/LytB domain-containing protein n=1 Tax=Neobacillus vireti TaxID=220686 RepID=UPI002FFF2CB1